jgi:hypothetical protein
MRRAQRIHITLYRNSPPFAWYCWMYIVLYVVRIRWPHASRIYRHRATGAPEHRARPKHAGTVLRDARGTSFDDRPSFLYLQQEMVKLHRVTIPAQASSIEGWASATGHHWVMVVVVPSRTRISHHGKSDVRNPNMRRICGIVANSTSLHTQPCYRGSIGDSIAFG